MHQVEILEGLRRREILGQDQSRREGRLAGEVSLGRERGGGEGADGRRKGPGPHVWEHVCEFSSERGGQRVAETWCGGVVEWSVVGGLFSWHRWRWREMEMELLIEEAVWMCPLAESATAKKASGSDVACV